jgi:carbon storage regulator
MLVLSRKKGESVVIEDHDGQEIIVTICAVEGGKVRVGITAPRSMRIDREEIHERRQAETINFEDIYAEVGVGD